MSTSQTSWFKHWFDSPYYHILYRNRDRSEAGRFVHHLMDVLKLPQGKKVLDLGCGKGRHCIMLNELGYDVVGIDLSAANIAAASEYGRADLQFIQHDMREPLRGLQFDLILNLFTSFGYFKELNDNLQVLQAVHSMLLPEGIFVLDFMNAEKVMNELTPNETKIVDNNHFDISRSVENGEIVKRIRINNNPELQFEERVQAFSKEMLFSMFEESNLIPESVYGSYQFEPFDTHHSDRLIITTRKK
ncbi:MAG: class I SAM-dependent methyltransferase [Cryomorphaceae bacterium]|nr:MAG: class I SAM-dependent methyltransferase [Cryomorphaceae bacterium]